MSEYEFLGIRAVLEATEGDKLGNVDVIKSDTDYWKCLKSSDGKLHVVDFSSKRCLPSLEILPHFAFLSELHRNIHFMTVDGDKCKEAMLELDINCYPTFVFIQNGKEINRIEGANKLGLDMTLIQITDLSDFPDSRVTPRALAYLQSSCNVDVVKCLAESWLDIAIYLRIDHEDIERIVSEQSESTECAEAMLTVWMKNKAPFHPTWSILLKALRAHCKEDLAAQIESGREGSPSYFHEIPAAQIPLLRKATAGMSEYETSQAKKMLECTTVEASSMKCPVDESKQVSSCRVDEPASMLKPCGIPGIVSMVSKSFNVSGGRSQTYTLEGYGVRLRIPSGALPPNLPPMKLQITPSLMGHYKFPDDCEVVSGIYWISFPLQFLEPATLDIQHYADVSTCSEDSMPYFAVAKCSQKNLPYCFEPVDGGVFTPHSCYGTLQITGFSGFAILLKKMLQSKVDSRAYTAQMFFQPHPQQSWTLHFVVSPSLEICKTAIMEFHKRMHMGHEVSISFQDDELILGIDVEKGVESGKWHLQALQEPVIRLSSVKAYRKCQAKPIPKCQIYLQWSDAMSEPTRLIHTIQLFDSNKKCQDKINIIFNPAPRMNRTEMQTTTTYEKRRIESADVVQNDEGSEPQDLVQSTVIAEMRERISPISPGKDADMPNLMNFPGKDQFIDISQEIGTHFLCIGTALLDDTTGCKTTNIIAVARGDPKIINYLILQTWVQGGGMQERTWGALVNVLKHCHCGALAENIEAVWK